eukprot:TRINITY_DN16899_c0_g1_i1.p1 TRINITY_DN16899_c0_g1~~TRINITY_DN16899_c0_g1_i1.p1  ORF type:complete len:600 (+),score=60.93 TRINITY_DN16899_c0_g1_i1:156-1802(+)
MDEQRLVLLMVGLPARGKSYVVHKLSRYMKWQGYNVRTFNVGNYRRARPEPTPDEPQEVHGSEAEERDELSASTQRCHLVSSSKNTRDTASFFDPANKERTILRDNLAMSALEDLLTWLKSGNGNVGIHDATNSTKARRRLLLERCQKEHSWLQVVFIENICTDQALLDRNVKMKLSNADYKDTDPEEALKDFQRRLAQYETAYEPIEENEADPISYIKVINVGRQVIANEIQGYLISQILTFLTNMHIAPRTIWLARAGQCFEESAGRLGGDSPLTELGHEQAKALGHFMRRKRANWRDMSFCSVPPVGEWLAVRRALDQSASPPIPDDSSRVVSPPLMAMAASSASTSPLLVSPSFPMVHRYNVGPAAPSATLEIWASTLKKSIETAEHIGPQFKTFQCLKEVDSGKCDGMTYAEIQELYPDVWNSRQEDKLRYRYPQGESYLDLIERLKPIILELERIDRDVVIVAHQAVLRVIYAYFVDCPLEMLPRLSIPQSSLIELTPKAYGCEEKRMSLLGEGAGIPHKTTWSLSLKEEELKNRKFELTPH